MAEGLRPLLGEGPWAAPEEDAPGKSRSLTERRAGFIIKVSLLVALVWWGFGLSVAISTESLAVLASLVDATIDLAAQGVLLVADALSQRGRSGSYPVGVARLEPVGVIVCSILMAMASGFVMWDSCATLLDYWPRGPNMMFTNTASVMLSIVVLVKIGVWCVAKFEYEKKNSVSLEALALDNFNDILSNFFALLFASLTRVHRSLWILDPIGGVFISIFIIRSWCLTAVEQINMLVGREANPKFLGAVQEMAANHHAGASLDVVRAYHFGPKFLVEVELVMDPATPLEVSHDVGMLLQHSIENLDEVERCFVHMDYQKRKWDDHDKNVPVMEKTRTPPARAATRSSDRAGLLGWR